MTWKLLAQDVTPCRKFTVSDGLPQGYISGIVQDKQGFIWIGTRSGIARYDGKKVKVFQHVNTDTNTLADNIVIRLYIDSRERLWIFYQNSSIDIFDLTTEKISHFYNTRGFSIKNLPFASNVIWKDFYEDHSHHCLLSCSNGVIELQPDLQKGILHTVDWALDTIAYGITEDLQCHLWLITQTRIIELDKNRKLLKTYLIAGGIKEQWEKNRFQMHYVQTCCSGNNLFIAGKFGIFIFNKADGTLDTVHTIRSNLRRVSCFNGSDGLFYYYYKYADTAKNESLYCFSARENKWRLIANASTTANYSVILNDNAGMVWSGTSGNGIRIYPGYPFTFYYSALPENISFQEKVISEYYGIPTNLVTAFNFNSYFFRWSYDRFGNLFVLGKTRSDFDESKYSVWEVSNRGLKLKTFKGITGIVNHYATILFDSKNNLIICSGTNIWVQDNHLKLKLIANLADIIKDGGISYSLIDDDDNIWFTNAGGLFKYELHSGECKNVFRQPEIPNPNGSDNALSFITQDIMDKNILWISSLNAGIVKLNKNTGRIQTFDRQKGLLDNAVYCMLQDSLGNLWCSSNSGIFRFDTKKYQSKKFFSADGAPDIEFNRYHCLRLPDGSFSFAGSEKYTVFNANEFASDTFNPVIAITDLKVNNKEARIPVLSSNLKNITFKYDQNFITVEFSALEYKQPEQTEYRYMLSGIDKDWVYSGTRNIAQYTNLSPGKYVLYLSATNASGKWSSNIKTMQIVISPPLTQTWWAYTLYFLFIASAIYWLFWNRLAHIRLQQAVILKQKEAEQTKALDLAKDHFFSNITHEFRTPLSLIISPVEHYLENPDQLSNTKNFLLTIHRNAERLLRLVNQVLDMSKVEMGRLQVFLSRGVFAGYIDRIVTSFEIAAKAKAISMHYECDAYTEYLFDADKWEKIIYNLLSNAIKFTPPGGYLRVLLKKTGSESGCDRLILQVIDSGVGISKDQLPYIFDRFYQGSNADMREHGGTGIGLALVKELIRLMNGEIQVESEVGKGTTFTVLFPLFRAEKNADEHETILPPITIPEAAPDLYTLPAGNGLPLILIAEDNKELNNFIAECLSPFYQIISVYDGKEAWEHTRQHSPDVIISDIMMPGMNGYDFCNLVKSTIATAHIIFIMLTAKAAYESKIDGLSKGADDYLAKPFHVQELLMRIKNMLARQVLLRDFYLRQLTPGTPLPEAGKLDDIFLQKFYAVIDDHIDDTRLSVTVLAEKLNVSTKTLNRKLSAIIGVTANELIKKYRMKIAAEFLKKGYNVSETAYRTGFDSPSYFGQCFKEVYGVTPKEFQLK